MKRVAIVGCGGIAQVHGWVVSQMEGWELAACVDIEIEKAFALSEKFTQGKAKVCRKLEELWKLKIDVIHICTPHVLHVPMAVEILRHDISVFMEKPPAISREQFLQLKQMLTISKGKIGFCFQNRYNSTTKELDELVASQTMGKVLGGRAFVTWRRDEEYYTGSAWKGKLETEGGGVLINQSIHTLDLLLRYLGAPEKVESSIHNHHLKQCIEVEDTVEVWMEFEQGKRACFYASNGYGEDAPIILEITFEKGKVTLLGQTIIVSKAGEMPHIHSRQTEVVIGKDYWGNGHLHCISDFYNSLIEGRNYQNDMEGIENTFDIMMQIYEKAGKNGGM